jgi:hypothetical protein
MPVVPRDFTMFAQSLAEYGIISWAAEGFRDLAYTIHDQFFGVDLEIRLLIGLGLLVAAAFWVRR